MEEKRINYKPSMPKLQQNSRIMRFVGVLILVICVAAISFVGGRIFEKESNSYFTKQNWGDFSKEEFDSSLFWDVWGMLKSNYVDEDAIDEEGMFYGAIKGMVMSLDDPATIFLTSEENEDFRKQTEGKHFEGIGAELGYRDGVIVIIAPLDGSPAKAAGLQPGEIILKIDNEDVKRSDSIYDVVGKIRGEKGTEVILTLMGRDMEIKDVTIVRDEITVPSMDFSETDSKGIYILKVGRFTEASLPIWKGVWDAKVEEFLKTGSNKLILDLRGNPGGFFDAGVYAAEDFLPKNTVIAKQQDRNGLVEEYRVSRDGRLLDVDVLVLVNEGSASASEILAGALQKNNRAKILGEDTYGKGTAQQVVDFHDGSSLHLTVVKWLLPDSGWINPENVIIPDVEVELTDDDFKGGVDPQLEKALELLGK